MGLGPKKRALLNVLKALGPYFGVGTETDYLRAALGLVEDEDYARSDITMTLLGPMINPEHISHGMAIRAIKKIGDEWLNDGDKKLMDEANPSVLLQMAVNDILHSLLDTVDGGKLIEDFAQEMEILTNDAQGYLEIMFSRGNDDEEVTIPEPDTAAWEALLGIGSLQYFRVCRPTVHRGMEQNVTGAGLAQCSMFQMITGKVKHSEGKQDYAAKCASIEFVHPGLNFSTRDRGIAAILMQACPSLELSRCVPYLDLKLVQPFPRVANVTEGQGQIGQGVSLFRFLNGEATVSGVGFDMVNSIHLGGSPPSQANEAMMEKYQADMTAMWGAVNADATPTFAGMEVFTAPQTLVPLDERFVDFGQGPLPQNRKNSQTPLDKTRPFMTIKDVTLKEKGHAHGLYGSCKRGTINLVLHDRSRLAEISALITPGVFNLNEIILEYGWSHPDYTSIWGSMFNLCRVKEKFLVKNNSMKFEANGQVNIALEVISKAGSYLSSVSIAEGDYQNTMEKLKAVVSEVQVHRAKVLKAPGMKDVAGLETMGQFSNLNTFSMMNADDVKKFEEMKKELSGAISADDYEALVGKLTEVMEGVAEAEATYDTILDEKMKVLKASPDAYMAYVDNHKPLNWKYFTLQTKDWPHGAGDGFYANAVVGKYHASFGKLAAAFVAAPLAATGEFEEVQLLFYPFNAKASYMSGMTIAGMPIEYSHFQDVMGTLRKKTPGLTVQQFLNMMNKEFFGNLAAQAYGFVGAGGVSREKKDGVHSTKVNNEKDAFNKSKEAVLKDAYGFGSAFKWTQPSISMFMEAVPVSGDTTGKKTICRVHFYDAAMTSSPGITTMMRSMKNNEFSSIQGAAMDLNNSGKKAMNNGGEITEVHVSHASCFMNELVRFEKAGLLEFVPGPDQEEIKTKRDLLEPGAMIKIKGDPNTVKQHIGQSMPVIKVNAEASGIQGADIATKHDAMKAAVFMQRSLTPRGNAPPSQVADAALPLRVMPAQLTINMVGNPFISPCQEFFFDFQTNTTVDNVYRVNSQTHKITPTNYTTDVTFNQHDRYGSFTALTTTIEQGIGDVKQLVDALEEERRQATLATIAAVAASPMVQED